MRLNGKIAIVTGGLSGIGQATASRFADEGATVIAADLTATATTLGDDTITPFRTDVSDPASVDALVQAILDKHGRIDCMVNCAGIAKDIPFLDTPLEVFDRIIAVNLRGTFIIGQAVARAMAANGGGAIVNVASVSGMTGNVGRTAYGASKGGVVNLSRVMAVDLAPFNIRVNVLSPGPIDTPLVAEVHTPATRAQWNDRVPMRRYGTPAEMASVALFLCSDDASYVTGHVLAADGGFMGAGLTVAPG